MNRSTRKRKSHRSHHSKLYTPQTIKNLFENKDELVRLQGLRQNLEFVPEGVQRLSIHEYRGNILPKLPKSLTHLAIHNTRGEVKEYPELPDGLREFDILDVYNGPELPDIPDSVKFIKCDDKIIVGRYLSKMLGLLKDDYSDCVEPYHIFLKKLKPFEYSLNRQEYKKWKGLAKKFYEKCKEERGEIIQKEIDPYLIPDLGQMVSKYNVGFKRSRKNFKKSKKGIRCSK